MTYQNVFKDSSQLNAEILEIVKAIEVDLNVIEFLINPISSSNRTPFGFHTIGFTKVALPEIYVSGIVIGSAEFMQLIPFIKSLHTFLILNGKAMLPAGEVSWSINEQLALCGFSQKYQARPIDTERLLYGQGLTLRHWLKHTELIDSAQAIQIVWRETSDVDFPMVNTDQQLLVDYVPFGVTCPKPIIEL